MIFLNKFFVNERIETLDIARSRMLPFLKFEVKTQDIVFTHVFTDTLLNLHGGFHFVEVSGNEYYCIFPRFFILGYFSLASKIYLDNFIKNAILLS